MADPVAATPPARHPLDPLTAAEIATAMSVLQRSGSLPDQARIISITLLEPTRSQLRTLEIDSSPTRRASVTLVDPVAHLPAEAIVDIDGARLVAYQTRPGQHAPITLAEYAACEQALRRDPRFRSALRRRGVTEPDQVLIESWGIGDFADSSSDPRRLVWTLAFFREQARDNPYAKPLSGLHAVVDIDSMTIIRLEDVDVAPLPSGRGLYSADQVSPLRTDLKPLHISQPDGVSFDLDGWLVRWQRWSFRIGFNAREGLTLHQVAYNDGGRNRSILHRASVAELVIPYADPRPYEGWRNAFDIGEYGIGIMTNSLTRGCDCLGEIRYLDVALSDPTGTPYTIPRAICLHEEDAGLLWKHQDGTLGSVEVRRSRRMVVSFIITAGNYEYAFYWLFYQDGSIEFEVRLTGVVLTTAIAPGESKAYGTVVAPGTLASFHQHFFSLRLDMEVDGPRNRVEEVDTVSVPVGPENPYGNAFVLRTTALSSERMAQRVVDAMRGRYWRIANPDVPHRNGRPVAYKLSPGQNILPFADPSASIRRRAGFMGSHLWVTADDPSQRFPAGDYPNQTSGGDGLPAWVQADRPLDPAELVIWYTLGSHHITRPEDWPVMPTERLGFTLKPDGFFDQNPALDVPP